MQSIFRLAFHVRDLAQARAFYGGLDFVMPPPCRFAGKPGEQWTMFFLDPSGNPIEVKGFQSLDAVFAS